MEISKEEYEGLQEARRILDEISDTHSRCIAGSPVTLEAIRKLLNPPSVRPTLGELDKIWVGAYSSGVGSRKRAHAVVLREYIKSLMTRMEYKYEGKPFCLGNLLGEADEDLQYYESEL